MAYFPDLHAPFLELVGALRGSPVLIVGHARPDGDCIGSQVALARLLQAAGHSCTCLNPDPVPRRLAFLCDVHPVIGPADPRPDGAAVVFTDCADALRVTRPVLETVGRPTGAIDHHLSHEPYALHTVVDATAAATAEILAGLALDLGLPIDAGTAAALYAGIATDTGQFAHGNTSRRVFEITGRLLDSGADPAAIAQELYGRESLARVRLLERFLSTLELAAGGRACIGVLPEGVFAETGALPEDTEGLVDYARGIDGVDVGILLEERADHVKGSLRSKDPAHRVDRIAARFNGGGHACAAGFKFNGRLLELRPRLLAEVAAALAATRTP